MDTYTFNKSKLKLFMGNFLILHSKYLRFWAKIFLKISKFNRKRSINLYNKGVLLIDEADGISFMVTKGILLDRNIMRLSITTLDNGKEKSKFFCYLDGDYKSLFIKSKGQDIEIEDHHLYLARDFHKEWKPV